MKRLNYVLFFLAIAITAAGAWPPSGQIKNFPGGMHAWDSSNATWRPVAVSGNGSLVAESAPINLTALEQQVVNLTANASAAVTTEITGTRAFILLKSQEPDKPFWVSIDGAAVIGSCMLVNDWIKLDVPTAQAISLISSETLAISVMEGGY